MTAIGLDRVHDIEGEASPRPRLFEHVNPEELSPEWRELAPILDRPRLTGTTPYIDRYPLLVPYSVKSSEWAERFAVFGDYPDPKTDPETYTKVLDMHINLFQALSGIHGISGRVDGFRRFTEALRGYNKNIGERGSLRRLEASTTEQLGVFLGDEDLLARSMLLNHEIYTDQITSDTKPYKIRSHFSKFDIAAAHANDRKLLEQLGLPWGADKLQSEFWETAETVLRRADCELATRNYNDGETNSVIGAGTEVVATGSFNDTLIVNGIFGSVYAAQAALQEDYFAQVPGEEVDRDERKHVPGANNGALYKLLIAAYDINVIRRNSTDRMKISIKKGLNDSRGQMPDIVRGRFKPHGGYADTDRRLNVSSPKEVLRFLIDFAAAKQNFWRGEVMSAYDLQVIDVFENPQNINLHTLKERYQNLTGKAINWLDLSLTEPQAYGMGMQEEAIT